MRVLEPELLDSLAPTDERAQQSRRDLRKLNWLMGHTRLMTRMMRGACFETLIDLGSGDGQFALNVAHKLGRRCNLVLVDQHSVAENIVVADVMDFLRALQPQSGTAVMANLFLHHFSDAGLRELFAEASRKVDWFFACEPRRSRVSLWAARLLPLIGCNVVTRHDALASIRAGFAGKELSALWRDREDRLKAEFRTFGVPPLGGPGSSWEIRERPAGFASHCFMASRL